MSRRWRRPPASSGRAARRCARWGGSCARRAGRYRAPSVPAGFLGTLRPYQAQGVDWLQFLRSAELGGVLADDMGLGKTVQTLAHLAIEQAEGRLDRPSLIVCPTSVVPNWTMEAARFAPSLQLLTLHGPARKERFGEIGQHDLVISTYPLLTRDHAVLTEHEWHVVVLDEAQMIKNPNAETTRAALRLQGAAAAGAVGDAVAEPSGRAVVAVRLPGAGVPGQRAVVPHPVPHADREARRRGAGGDADEARAAVPAAPDQGRGGAGPAAEDRDHRAGGDGGGAARDLRGRAAVDACAGAAGDRGEGHRAVGHHHPGRAAEAAPGVLRSAAAEAEGGGEDEGRLGQAGAADGAADGDAGGRAARAAVLAVHLDAGADRGAAGGGVGCRT